MPNAAPQNALRVVKEGQRSQELQTFCGHCGRPPSGDGEEQPRVCQKCGLGLLISAPRDVAPKASDPFLVVDGSLTVCALSREAERLLGVMETDAVNRHVGEFLVAGDSEAKTAENLASTLSWAARGDAPAQNVVVRPSNTFGVRYWARVGPCGPPNAALLVLADAR